MLSLKEYYKAILINQFNLTEETPHVLEESVHPLWGNIRSIWKELGSPGLDSGGSSWTGNITWGDMVHHIRNAHRAGQIPDHKLDQVRSAILQNHIAYWTGLTDEEKKMSKGYKTPEVTMGSARVNRSLYEPQISHLDPLSSEFESQTYNIRQNVRKQMKRNM